MKARRLMVCLGAATGALVLSGCGLPLPLVVATYAVDGVVLVASGKTASDHVISAVADEDCALWRAATWGDICVANETGIVAEDDTGDAIAALPAGSGSASAPALTRRGDAFPLGPPIRTLAAMSPADGFAPDVQPGRGVEFAARPDASSEAPPPAPPGWDRR